MRYMGYFVLAVMALLTLALTMGCQSCYRASKVSDNIRNSKEVPAAIADAKLLRYQYTLNGTMRYPLHCESVEICNDDSTRCIIRLFEEYRSTSENFDENGEIVPDSVIVGSEVLDSIKQMIIDAKAWRFEKSYSPRVQTLDGNSWGYSATFSITDALLAATPEAERPRLLRRGGLTISSDGSNASPDTKLFEQVRQYLYEIYQSQKNNQPTDN